MPDPQLSAHVRRTSRLIGWLLLVLSLPPVLDRAIFSRPGWATWAGAQRAMDLGSRVAGTEGAVVGVCSWFFGAWGVFVPALLAAAVLARVLAARRAVVLTAIYIVIVLLISGPWSYYVNRGRPMALIMPLDRWLRSGLTETPALVLACIPWPASNERPWRWGATVTRIVLLCTGVLGLLLVTPGMLGKGTVLGGWELKLYRGSSSLQAMYFALEFYCALVMVRHGVVRRRWLWLGTAGALIVWVLSRIVGLILERDPMLQLLDFLENWVIFQARLGSLAAATGVLLWYWWPVLAGGVRPVVAEVPLCPVCGYNLTGNVSGRCPECGSAVAAGPSQSG